MQLNGEEPAFSEYAELSNETAGRSDVKDVCGDYPAGNDDVLRQPAMAVAHEQEMIALASRITKISDGAWTFGETFKNWCRKQKKLQMQRAQNQPLRKLVELQGKRFLPGEDAVTSSRLSTHTSRCLFCS